MEVLIVILIILAVVVVGGILIYNGLVQRRLRIDEAFAQIEVQLKRRWDLIPNLIWAAAASPHPAQGLLNYWTTQLCR